jgi:hypothetical protein
VLLLLRHWKRVRRRWNPPLEVLTLMSTSPPIIEKEVPWVELVWTVDPLKEKTPLMGLHNKIQKKY